MDQQPTHPARSALRLRAAALEVSLTTWRGRVEPSANARTAASDAVSIIDDMIRELHETRRQLVHECHEYDAETMRRSGELLDRIRAERNA